MSSAPVANFRNGCCAGSAADRVADDVGGDHPLVDVRARLHVLRQQVRQHVRAQRVPDQNEGAPVVEVPDEVVKAAIPSCVGAPATIFTCCAWGRAAREAASACR